MLRRNVLILHQGALGDFVMTWPLAMAMGRLFPQSRIFYVTSRDKGRLAERATRVESSDIEAGWHALFADGGSLPDASAKLLTGAHTVLSFIGKPGDTVGANLRRLAPEANVLELSTAPAGGDQHVAEQYVSQLEKSPAMAEAVRQILRSVRDRGLPAYKPVARSVVLHPGSGADRKNWPADRFVELAKQLQAAGRSVQIVLGEVEREKMTQLQIADFAAVGKIVQPSDLLGLFNTLATAETFVGNDSGPGHLAAIMGCRSVIIGIPNPAWRPIGPAVRPVEAESLNSVSVATVLAAATT